MMLHVPEVLGVDQARACLRKLQGCHWSDGTVTAGHQSARAKHNLQLSEADPLATRLRNEILQALQHSATFMTGALPRHIFPPLFNCYCTGHDFGTHVDNAVRYDSTGEMPFPLRTDISATLFLSSPGEYDGGELVIEDTYGTHQVKLPQGDLVLYPSGSLHRVLPVTRGARIAAFFWVQSMIRDDGKRQLLFDLDVAIQNLTRDAPTDHPALKQLVGTYHNLLRRWTEL